MKLFEPISVACCALTLATAAHAQTAAEAPASPAEATPTADQANTPATPAQTAPTVDPSAANPSVVAVAPAPTTTATLYPSNLAQPMVPAVAPVSVQADPNLGKDGYPLAGYRGGYFYLRDTDDNYRLYLQGRAHIDFYSYAGPGVSDTTLKPTLFLRRARPELSGEFFHRWWFMIAGDFGTTAIDNPKGTNQTSAAAPGVAPIPTTARYNSAETAKVSAAPTDVFINFRALPWLNFQFGQFDAPFTMENRTSEKWGTPFMERSMTVRDVAVPTQKQIGLMAWGEPAKEVYYSIGLFDGEGQNRPNVDSRFDVFARAYVLPLASTRTDALKNLQFGASVRYGSRDHNYVNYDVPALTTQGQYAFWNPTYTSSQGTTHIIYSGPQQGVAFEARVPYGLFDVTSEVAIIDKATREALEGFEATSSQRFGSLRGYSYYAELGFWPLGNRDINGLPGVQNPPHVDFTKPEPETPPRALQLLVKWEQVRLNYSSARRLGTPDKQNIDGDIKVDALSFGANYWLTKHLRFTVNYILNMFPDSGPTKASPEGAAQTSANRAQAPGNTLAVGTDDSSRNTHVLHEILARAAVAF